MIALASLTGRRVRAVEVRHLDVLGLLAPDLDLVALAHLLHQLIDRRSAAEHALQRAVHHGSVGEDRPDVAVSDSLEVVEEEDIEGVRDRNREDIPTLRHRDEAPLAAEFGGDSVDHRGVELDPS